MASRFKYILINLMHYSPATSKSIDSPLTHLNNLESPNATPDYHAQSPPTNPLTNPKSPHVHLANSNLNKYSHNSTTVYPTSNSPNTTLNSTPPYQSNTKTTSYWTR